MLLFSVSWTKSSSHILRMPGHLKHLRVVLRLLRVAGLTANPKKCTVGRVEVWYLGLNLAHGQVHPQIDKAAPIASCPNPKIKKEVNFPKKENDFPVSAGFRPPHTSLIKPET